MISYRLLHSYDYYHILLNLWWDPTLYGCPIKADPLHGCGTYGGCVAIDFGHRYLIGQVGYIGLSGHKYQTYLISVTLKHHFI